MRAWSFHGKRAIWESNHFISLNFLGWITSFSYPWCSAGARELRYYRGPCWVCSFSWFQLVRRFHDSCSEKYYRLFLVTYIIHTFTKRSKMWVIEKFNILSIFLSFFIYFVFISNEMTKDSCKLNLPRGNARRIFKDKRK